MEENKAKEMNMDEKDVAMDEKENVGSKVWNGLKKHGKKIGGAVLLGVVGCVGYVLGSNSNNDECDDDIISNAFDPTFEDVE